MKKLLIIYISLFVLFTSTGLANNFILGVKLNGRSINIDMHTTTDSTGRRPSSVVDAFIKAYLADDKDKVSELVGKNEQLLAILYNNKDATTFLKRIYSHTYKIEGKAQPMGDASVTISFIDNGSFNKGGFELMKSQGEFELIKSKEKSKYTKSAESRWIIRQIY